MDDWSNRDRFLQYERSVLGSILVCDSEFARVARSIRPTDFTLAAHRIIFRTMAEIYGRGERIDRVVLTNELMKHNQLGLVGGVPYLAFLDDDVSTDGG